MQQEVQFTAWKQNIPQTSLYSILKVKKDCYVQSLIFSIAQVTEL